MTPDAPKKESLKEDLDTKVSLKPDTAHKAEKAISLLPETKYPFKDGYPIWFYNPHSEGYLGGVGVAAPQPRDGIAAQKRVAQINAQRELAANIKVLVNTTVETEKLNIDTATLSYYQTKISTLSRQQAEEFISKYEVLDEWINTATGEYYIWLVLTK